MDVTLLLDNFDAITLTKEHLQSIHLYDIKENLDYENYFDEPSIYKTVGKCSIVIKYDENLTFKNIIDEEVSVFERLACNDITSILINGEQYYVEFKSKDGKYISENMYQSFEKYYDEIEGETIFSITIGKE